MAAKLETTPDAYTGCSCTRTRDVCTDGTLSNRNAECPIHRKSADVGMREVHAMLRHLLPTASILGQVPVMSEGVQGRDPDWGFWTAGPDLHIDLLVQASHGVWVAVEVNGPDHRGAAAVKRDKKKWEVLQKKCVAVIVLPWYNKKGKRVLPRGQWERQIEQQLGCMGAHQEEGSVELP